MYKSIYLNVKWICMYTAWNLKCKPITLKPPRLSLEALSLLPNLIPEIDPQPWILGFIPPPYFFFSDFTSIFYPKSINFFLHTFEIYINLMLYKIFWILIILINIMLI